MVDKISDETKAQAVELRKSGKSIRQISRQLKIGVGSAYRATVGVKPSVEESPARSGELVRGAGKGTVPVSEEVVELANTVRKLELELQQRQVQRKLRVLQDEEDLAIRERELEVRERRMQLAAAAPGQAGESQAGQPGHDTVLDEVQKLQAERAALEAEKGKLQEERHKLEMDALKEQIASLSTKLDSAHSKGATEWDILGQALQLVGKEIGELRKDAVTLINSPNIARRFAPGRYSSAFNRQVGESLATGLEGGELLSLTCPGCRQIFNVDVKTLGDFPILECPGCHLRFANPASPKPKEEPEVKTGELP